MKCFDADAYSSQDNKLFEVPSSIKYQEFQEAVNKKYSNQPILIQFVDEE